MCCLEAPELARLRLARLSRTWLLSLLSAAHGAQKSEDLVRLLFEVRGGGLLLCPHVHAEASPCQNAALWERALQQGLWAPPARVLAGRSLIVPASCYSAKREPETLALWRPPPESAASDQDVSAWCLVPGASWGLQSLERLSAGSSILYVLRLDSCLCCTVCRARERRADS